MKTGRNLSKITFGGTNSKVSGENGIRTGLDYLAL